MAGTASSQHRAQLIREMSKDMNRTRNSSGSSRHSASPEPTTSNFDPENEAIMSTRQLDNHSQQLPQRLQSAQKYSRRSPSIEPDFAINTSAIGRAFPDFSQGGTSSEDDSISIEVGRGIRKNSVGTIGKLGRSKEHSSHGQLGLDDGDSMDFSAAVVGDYEVTATPPLKQRDARKKSEHLARESPRHVSHARKPSGLQHQFSDPSPPPAKIVDYGSGESRKTSGESRRTLASIHARVRDNNEQSYISEERPPTMDLTARNTRFGNTQNLRVPSQGTLPTRFSSAQTLLNSVAPINKQKLQASTTPNQGTQQSFMLPDLPNISELVSGVFEDGTPVFSRHGKSRASRFAPVAQPKGSSDQEYANVYEIPVPDDEQAIFLSLKLLQDKVATLEKSNAEAANTIDELQQKNQKLESAKQDRRRPPRNDSALGSTDSDNAHETSNGHRKVLIEKNRLESSVRALQQQVDAGQRKSSTAETILKQITQERDSAVSQLGVAYVTIEQLKADNESLIERNEELSARVDELTRALKGNVPSQKTQEAHQRQQLASDLDTAQLTKKKAKAEKRKVQHSTANNTREQDLKQSEQKRSERPIQKDTDTMFDLSIRQKQSRLHEENENDSDQNETSRNSDTSFHETDQRKKKGKATTQPYFSSKDLSNDEGAQNLTYLSFLDNQEIARLRRTLEQERIERKQRRNNARQQPKSDPTITQTGLVRPVTHASQNAVPRKSSMKNLTVGSTGQKQEEQRLDGERRHSDSSKLSTRNRRQELINEDMTSAFIVPDITIHKPVASSSQVPELASKNQELLDNIAAHSHRSCSVCKRTACINEQHNNEESKKQTIGIPKPVPVSERKQKASDEGDDPTIRPAQSPGLALATVLKELEDEVVHLKLELHHFQDLFNSHDPALSKRKRKIVQDKIENTLRTIDVKADQIYALYDVLEGQKQDGHEMSEEEVEVTLQSIGVRAPEMHLRGGGDGEFEAKDEKPIERHAWELDSDGDSSEDLPWEGIETTIETTSTGHTSAARRKLGD
ncbi:hypothetical protein ACLMJK_006052 [Lecanora helva]